MILKSDERDFVSDPQQSRVTRGTRPKTDLPKSLYQSRVDGDMAAKRTARQSIFRGHLSPGVNGPAGLSLESSRTSFFFFFGILF